LLLAILIQPSAGRQSAAPGKSTALTPAERKASAAVKVETIRKVTSTLASPEMEGRGTATPGGDRAAAFIKNEFVRLGLKPLGDAGTYFQAIKFKSYEAQPESAVTTGDAVLKFGEDFVPAPPLNSDKQDVTGGLVFVGYGVVSPELKRDDLSGLDLKGKIVVVTGARPKNVDAAAWAKAASPEIVFGGLFLRGIAGVIAANATDEPYSLVANYLSRRRVSLADDPALAFKLPPILLASSEGMEKLFAGSGGTFAQAVQKLENGERASQDFNRPATINLRVKREEGTGSNVAGLLEGSDPKLKEEAIIYTAHYDAYGKGSNGQIFAGAADNALGVGMVLSIAEAFAKSGPRPKRSIIFLALTGEEYGLLGSEYWVKHPAWPLEKIAANLNYDGIGTEVYGPVKQVVGYGLELSEIGPIVENVAAATGIRIVPDPLPEEKAFERSDHYAFVKKGVPAMMLLGAPDTDTASLVARIKKWIEADYHQPSDIVRPEWNWDGPRTLAVTGMLVGARVANGQGMPKWRPSSRFQRPAPAAHAPAPRL